MPWVRLDDRFPSHRKVALLSDRAFRLYVSALCWSSEALTEGRIADRELPLVAPRLRGVKGAAAELETARLWDRVEGGWDIHDYLTYNPDRARVEADRAANAARQKAWRDRKRTDQETAEKPDRNGSSNAPSNGVTNGARNTPGESTKGKTRHDGDTTNLRARHEGSTPPQVNDIRNGVTNGTPSPSPSHVPPTEVQPPPSPSTNATGSRAVEVSGRGEVQPLIEAMTARGMRVSWTFQAAEWRDLRDAVRRVGVPALVDHAARAWQAARTEPYSAKYFLTGWTGLQDAPAYTGPRALNTPPSKASTYVADMARIAEELRAAGGENT